MSPLEKQLKSTQTDFRKTKKKIYPAMCLHGMTYYFSGILVKPVVF